MARWLERLSDFDFEVERRPGQLHGNADELSSLPWEEDASFKDRRNATLIQSANMEQGQLCATQNQDPVLSQDVSWLKTCVKPLEVTWMEGGANCYRTGHIGEGCF